MAKTNFETRGTPAAESLMADLFALGRVGYVAIGADHDMLLRKAPGVVDETTAETDFYEETLVNPTLLKLASQRARIDCGGLSYVAIGYGDFTQLILLTRDGHVSLGVSKKEPVRELAGRVHDVLEKHDLAWRPAPTWLLAEEV